jgi:hypothetical protein
MDTTWMAQGNCAIESPNLFFPSDGVGVEVARRVCANCPVKEPCLESRSKVASTMASGAAAPNVSGGAS